MQVKLAHKKMAELESKRSNTHKLISKSRNFFVVDSRKKKEKKRNFQALIHINNYILNI